MNLVLTETERMALHNLLAQTLKSLPVEIHRTESIDFRKSLEETERTLRSIERRLGTPAFVES